MGIKNSYIDIKNSVSLGNRTLYELCNNHPLNSNPDDDEIDSLASKIWLIGRSYAASPERRNYTKSKKSLGNKLKTNNDGENFFFEELARNILSNDKFTDLVESARNNATISFKVDNKKYDRQLLIESVRIVFLFNELLRESIKQIDYNITKNVGKKCSY